MVSIAGLERIAEELMGLRKWKKCQETLMLNQLNAQHFTDIKSINKEIESKEPLSPAFSPKGIQIFLLIFSKVNNF